MSGFDKYLLQARLWRRHLHQHPELSHQEFQTSAFIKAEMEKLPHAEISQLTPTSVLVTFKTGLEGAKIGLRADIDALPIQEERPDLAFASQNDGVMHACGHDGNAAILMAVCSCISDNFSEFTGEIYAIFQHAEEAPYPGGAAELANTRFFDDFDFIYGQRLVTNLPTGFVDIKKGACSTNTDNYRVNIRSKDPFKHNAPQFDPIFVGAQFITLLHKLTTQRSLPRDSLMIVENSIFCADGKANAIPENARLAGTVKTTSDESRAWAAMRIENLLREVCLATNADYDFAYERGCSVILNHPVKTEIVRELAAAIYGDKVTALPFLLDREDFSEFSHLVPSTFVTIGAANAENSAPHHSPKFGLDEESFVIAFTLMLEIAHKSHLFK